MHPELRLAFGSEEIECHLMTYLQHLGGLAGTSGLAEIGQALLLRDSKNCQSNGPLVGVKSMSYLLQEVSFYNRWLLCEHLGGILISNSKLGPAFIDRFT